MARDLLHLLVDRGAELLNLLARTHIDGEGNGAAAVLLALGVGPGIEIQVRGGALVRAVDLDHISEVNGRACLGGPEDGVADGAGVFELAGGVDIDFARASLDGAAGERDIAGEEDAAEVGGLKAEGGETLLGIIEVDGLGEDAVAVDTRGLGDAEEGAGDEIGVVIELLVGVLETAGG